MNHSTGRGGAGNIGKDDTVYVDGSIVREGPAGETVDGIMSTGRGGAGNVGDPTPSSGAASQAMREEDVIPEPAMREAHQSNFHTGRGGEGNIHKDKYGGHSHAQKEPHAAADGEHQHHGLGDKVKHALGLDKKDHAK